MSYTTYKTEGIVLSGVNTGETSRYLHIFTKDLGLVSCHAQGLRALKSKLRYSLQDFSYSSVDLVRGRNVWRVTSARGIDAFSSASTGRGVEVVAKTCHLLKRLLKGEEKNEQLFHDVLSGFIFLKDSTHDKHIFNTEIIIVMRVLHDLGYWCDDKTFATFFTNSAISNALVREIENIKTSAVKEINHSLQESQL